MATVTESWDGTVFSPPLKLDLASTQAAIVARLKAAGGSLARVEVAGFPDKPVVYRLTHPLGAVLVVYEGSLFTHGDLRTPAPTTIDEVRQERSLTWSITVVSRGLGWDYSQTGAYAFLEAVRSALTGFQVNQGFTKLAPLTERFIRSDPDGGVWFYEIRMCHRSVVVNAATDVDYPVLRDVQYTRVEQPTTVYTFANDGTLQLPRQDVRDLVVMNSAMSITYDLGEDYAVDGPSGVVTAVGGGALGPGSQVRVKFAFIEAEVSDL